MTNIKKIFTLSTSVTLSLLTTHAVAFTSGDIIIRGGAAMVSPQSQSEDIDQVAGARVSAGSNTQLGLSGTYMLTPRIGLELLAATPFKHSIKGKGLLSNTDIGTAEHLPPTLSVEYFLLDAGNKFQPYIGIGINYTFFFNEETSSDLNGSYSKLSLDESTGFATQVGADYMFNEHLGLNASVMYAQIGTTATLSGGAGTLTVDYDLDPMVYRMNMVYKF